MMISNMTKKIDQLKDFLKKYEAYLDVIKISLYGLDRMSAE
jgi:hypothetical protein